MGNIMRLFTKKPDNRIDSRALARMLGFKPRKLSLYQLAFTDPALRSEEDPNGIATNDRLEFLGDSILGMFVTKHLYRTRPNDPVGKLSALKAHIVSRQVSNGIAEELGLSHFFPPHNHVLYGKDANGNALEALIGAIYLDRGFSIVERFIVDKVLPLYFEKKHESQDFGRNFKGELQSWADKKNRLLEYRTSAKERSSQGGFYAEVYVDNKKWGDGSGHTKKEAEQKAASLVLSKLGK